MDSKCKSYCNYYDSQIGGDLSVFRGTRFQEGAGFADFFRGVIRFLSPIVSNAAKTLVSSANQSLSSGKNWKEVAKTALVPTIASGLGTLTEQIGKKLEKQEGGARRVYKRKMQTKFHNKKIIAHKVSRKTTPKFRKLNF